MGKNLHCWCLVLFGFCDYEGLDRVIVKLWKTGSCSVRILRLQGFGSGSVTIRVQFGASSFCFFCIRVLIRFGSLENKGSS